MKRALAFLLIVLIGETYAQTFNEELSQKLDTLITQYADINSPGVAVGIVQNGTVVYENYSGLSNLEHKIPVGANTRFNIASNAKQYTALCLLKLVEEGKLSLDEDFRKYLPDFFQGQQNKISVRQLIAHTSGIRDVYDLWALKGQTWWKLFVDNNDALELIKSQKDLNFNPGTKYLYSNSNYILITEIIKVVSGQRFDEYAFELFKELGMEQTSFNTNHMAVIPDKARPYGNWNGWKEYPYITETHGDGALFTTLADQLNWEIIVQNNNHSSIAEELIDLSQQPLVFDYGYGLMFGEYKGLSYAYHNGSTGAYNATFLRFPNKNTAIVVLSNNGNVPTNFLAKQLADFCLNIQDPVISSFPAGPAKISNLNALAEVVGNYKTTGGTIIKIVESDGELYREIYQRDPVRLINERGNLFHYETNKNLKIAFTKEKSDVRKFTIYLSTQPPNVGVRIPSMVIDRTYYASLNGKYYNDETDTTIEIIHLNNDAYSITKNGRKRNGQLIIKDLLRMNSYEIRIARDKEEKITGLNVKNNRIENVIFEKR